MNAIVAVVIAVFVSFVAIVWPMRKAAQLVGADRDGYGTVVLALVLSMGLSIVGAIFIGVTGAGGIASSIGGVVVVLAAMVFLYAKVFGTGMLGGFLIMVIANLIGGMVMIGMAGMLGIGGMFLGGGKGSEQLRPVVDQLCACDGDRACQEEQWQALSVAVVRMKATTGGLDAEEEARVSEEIARAQGCTQGGAPALPEVSGGTRPGSGSGDRQGSSSGGRAGGTGAGAGGAGGSGTDGGAGGAGTGGGAGGTGTGGGAGGTGAGGTGGEGAGGAQGGDSQTGAGAGEPREARRRAPPPSYTMVWQDTSTDELPALMGEVLRFELSDGRQREGILLSVQGGQASLRSLQSRGLSYDVDLGTVTSVKVYSRVLQ